MLKVNQARKDNILSLRLEGTIDEDDDFTQVFGPQSPALPGEIHVHCKDVSRINSSGVRSWIAYFQEFANRQVKLKFSECSPAITEQLSLIKNFNCGGLVESVYAPYACSKCHRQFVTLFKVDDLKGSWKNLPQATCPSCGGKAEFDDIPAEYFGFLARN